MLIGFYSHDKYPQSAVANQHKVYKALFLVPTLASSCLSLRKSRAQSDTTTAYPVRFHVAHVN